MDVDPAEIGNQTTQVAVVGDNASLRIMVKLLMKEQQKDESSDCL